MSRPADPAAAPWHDGVRAALRALPANSLPSPTAALRLDANESPYPPPPGLLDALAAELPALALNRYPDPRASRLRAAIARDLAQPEDRLVLGDGSDELIGLCCATFAEPRPGEPSARVVWPGPSFVVYRIAAAAHGLTPVEAPLGPRFASDPDALDAAIAQAAPRLVFLATPNNPTGTEWPRAQVERLVAAHPETVFVVDEAYHLYARQSFLDLVAAHPHCAVLRTYSKIGLAGLRVGVLVAQPALATEVEKVRPPYNLGQLPQLAAAIALERFGPALRQHVDQVIAERERLASALAALPGVEVFPSSANLLLCRVAGAAAIARDLEEHGIRVRDFDRPGPLAGCLRITVGTPEEDRLLLDALAARLRP